MLAHRGADGRRVGAGTEATTRLAEERARVGDRDGASRPAWWRALRRPASPTAAGFTDRCDALAVVLAAGLTVRFAAGFAAARDA